MVDIVIDTVVFVRSLINPNSIWGELVFRRRNHYRLIVSEPIIDEILEVIRRPSVVKKFARSGQAAHASIERFLIEALMVEPAALPWSGRDPNDDKFVAAAIAGGASYIVSEDRDLLDLGSYEGVSIVDTATFLRLLNE